VRPSEYEDYIADIVSAMNFGDVSSVRKRVQLPGVRQPGTYEVDVAVTFEIAAALRFLVIVECKRTSRPVDRPVVQKLAQTRDAVGAHKAAIVSPVGFTREAREVALAHGIALWIVAEEASAPVIEVYRMSTRGLDWHYERLRGEFLEAVNAPSPSSTHGHLLVSADYALTINSALSLLVKA